MCKYYLVKDSELLQLTNDSNLLLALEHGGVDNWTWYAESVDTHYDKATMEDLDKLYESVKK